MPLTGDNLVFVGAASIRDFLDRSFLSRLEAAPTRKTISPDLCFAK
jgi:hypothetical protein